MGTQITCPCPAEFGNPDTFDIEPGVTLTMKNVSIRAGATAGSALDVQGTLDLESSSLSENQGSFVILDEPTGSLTLRNTTLNHNSGIAVDAQGAAALFNDTISGNAFGVFPDGGSVALTNTIVANNTTHDCSSHVTSAVTSIDTDGTCGVPLTAAPRLATLDNNGGSTLTQALLPGSPAIDAGPSAPRSPSWPCSA